MACLARVPRVGDRVTCAKVVLEVIEMEGRRIDKVLVVRPSENATSSEDS